MKQEVEVLIKLTLEVDADKSKENIKHYVEGRGLISKYNSTFPYNIMDYEVLTIKEEAEIYENEE